VTNTLAYYTTTLQLKMFVEQNNTPDVIKLFTVKMFEEETPRPDVLKMFTTIIYECS
jgi:uncharacterized membrane protein